MNHFINQAIPPKHHRAVVSCLRKRLPILVVATALAACASVPHTGRRQFNAISDSQMNALSVQAFQQVLEKEQESNDERMNAIVKRVVERVSKAAELVDKPGFSWDVRLMEKDTPNAFCLPGGKIVVFTGIIPYARNEAGLAAIIAHEVAHAVARHGGERLSQQLALKGAIFAGGEIFKKKDGALDSTARAVLGALGMGGTIGVILPYSRIHELEADQIGQIYMARAGYDPSEAVKVWKNMARIKKPPIPVWLSTHPADDERIRKLEEHLPDARKHYAEATAKHGKGYPL